MEKELSVYIHIPFCVRKCNYCDFLSFHAKKDLINRYFEALKKEIMLSSGDKGSGACMRVRSVFFGGGTPSFVDSDLICDILKALGSSFDIKEDAEISIEVNPASAMLDKLVAYKKAGFNRLSIGAQSLNDKELKVLGRAHDSQMFLETFENARKADFTNINVDVMSALPGQSLDTYLDTLKKVTDLNPEHISAYSLIIEEGTPFFDMDLDLPDEDTDRAMYHETKKFLLDAGFHRYEISNYAREGFECIHNKVYWERGNYLGLGLGASSMVEEKRWRNTDDIKEYSDKLLGYDGSFDFRKDVRTLSEKEQMEEFMFLGLRLTRGVKTDAFHKKFGKEISEVYGEVIEKYRKMGLLEFSGDGNYLRLTDKGLDVSNTVMADFLL